MISKISFTGGETMLTQGIKEVANKKAEYVSCNLTTGFICTDTLIILDSPLCEGVFRSEN